MNFNVLTKADVLPGVVPRLDEYRPPGAPPGAEAPPPAAPGAAPMAPPAAPPEPDGAVDDYWAKLRKYIPAEVIGGYLLLYGLLSQLFNDASEVDTLRVASIVLVAFAAVLAYLGARSLYGVRRISQRLLSAFAIVLWSISDGSLFGTYDWWEPVMGSIAVVAFGVTAAVVRMKPLADAPA